MPVAGRRECQQPVAHSSWLLPAAVGYWLLLLSAPCFWPADSLHSTVSATSVVLLLRSPALGGSFPGLPPGEPGGNDTHLSKNTYVSVATTELRCVLTDDSLATAAQRLWLVAPWSQQL